MEICSRNSSMTDPIEICTNKDSITNSAEISSRRDRMADSTEISGKDDCTMNSHARRTKLCQEGDLSAVACLNLRSVVVSILLPILSSYATTLVVLRLSAKYVIEPSLSLFAWNCSMGFAIAGLD